jgi:outer membrane lipoprotein-sorting protein
MGPSGGFAMMFTLVPVFIMVVFAAVIVAIIVAVVKNAGRAAANNAAPEVSAVATVADKRIETTGGGDMPVSQHHFVTFEQPGGERFELEAPAAEFGLLVVGDRGSVTMKGTKYLAFARELMR